MATHAKNRRAARNKQKVKTKKVKATSNKNSDTFKWGEGVGAIKKFKNIKFADYLRMKEISERPSTFFGAVTGNDKQVKADIKYIEDNNMVNVTASDEHKYRYYKNKQDEQSGRQVNPSREKLNKGIPLVEGDIHPDQVMPRQTKRPLDWSDEDSAIVVNKPYANEQGFNSSRNSMMGDWNNLDRARQYETNVPYTRDTSLSDTTERVENYRFPNKGTNYTEQFNGNGDGGSQVMPMLPQVEVTAPQRNNFGYHIKPNSGQNFWTVNNDDPYWNTHEIGTGDYRTESALKGKETPELDVEWFKKLFS